MDSVTYFSNIRKKLVSKYGSLEELGKIYSLNISKVRNHLYWRHYSKDVANIIKKKGWCFFSVKDTYNEEKKIIASRSEKVQKYKKLEASDPEWADKYLDNYLEKTKE